MNTFFFASLLISATICVISADVDLFRKEFGGIEVQPHSIPFIVSLIHRPKSGETVTFCSGSLLSEHWILTASHCLDLFPEVEVLAGHHSMDTLGSTTQVRKAFALYRHKPYMGEDTGCIGLIYVENGFNFTKEVQPVALEDVSIAAGDKVTLQGWGGSLSSKIRIYPKNLRSANLSVTATTVEQCSTTYLKVIDEETMFCVDGSACVEEAGGPVLKNGAQVGIVPWRMEDCDASTRLSMFIKVSPFKSWIQGQISSTVDLIISVSEVNFIKEAAQKIDEENLIQIN